MYMTDMKPLKPLPHGNILIVGTKSSNFDDEIRTHPRVIMWDGLNETWKGKSIPENVQAVFFTRFIGHNAWGMIVSEARKKHLTIFNPLGTGVIARQVKQLLAVPPPVPVTPIAVHTLTNEALTEKIEVYQKQPGKLIPLLKFIDWNMTNKANANYLMIKAEELGIKSTLMSLNNFVAEHRRRQGIPTVMRRGRPRGSVKSVKYHPPVMQTEKGLDAAVQMLDNAIKELKDMREFLVATTNENKSLRTRLTKLKEMFNE